VLTVFTLAATLMLPAVSNIARYGEVFCKIGYVKQLAIWTEFGCILVACMVYQSGLVFMQFF